MRLISLFAPPLLVMGVIFYMSAQANFVPTHGFWETFARKTFHALEYFVLTLCWIRALRFAFRDWSLAVVLTTSFALALTFAVSDELHQTAVSGRHGSPRDVAIDSIGMLAAVLLGYLRLRGVRRRSEQGTRARADLTTSGSKPR